MKKTKLLVFWNPFEEKNGYPGAEIFSDYVKHNTEIICVDLKNNKDPHSLKFIEEADLIVIFLKQDQTCLDTYFSFCRIRQERILYLVYDYFECYAPNAGQMVQRYRIPEERLCVLPFNIRLIQAMERGCLSGYLKNCDKRRAYEQFADFFFCFNEACKKLHQALFSSSGSLR